MSSSEQEDLLNEIVRQTTATDDGIREWMPIIRDRIFDTGKAINSEIQVFGIIQAILLILILWRVW